MKITNLEDLRVQTNKLVYQAHLHGLQKGYEEMVKISVLIERSGNRTLIKAVDRILTQFRKKNLKGRPS